MAGLRRVAKVLTGARSFDDPEAWHVRRALPHASLAAFDPVLGVDELNAELVAEVTVFRDRRRGLTCLTYVLEGQWQERDAHGHTAALGAGDFLGAPSGAGTVAEVQPGEELRARGGRLRLVRICVRSPAQGLPEQHHVVRGAVPKGWTSDGRATVRVLVGEAAGLRAPWRPERALTLLHLSLEPRGVFVYDLDAGAQACVYALDGTASLSGSPAVRAGQLAYFDGAGDQLRVENLPQSVAPFDCMLVVAAATGEPLHRQGNVVASSAEDLKRALHMKERS